MGQSTIHTDDINPIEQATHIGVLVTLEDTSVQLDLSDENYDELCDLLAVYLSAGSPAKKPKGRSDVREVRAWALQQDVFKDRAKGRGRLSKEIYAAYDAAQAG